MNFKLSFHYLENTALLIKKVNKAVFYYREKEYNVCWLAATNLMYLQALKMKKQKMYAREEKCMQEQKNRQSGICRQRQRYAGKTEGCLEKNGG